MNANFSNGLRAQSIVSQVHIIYFICTFRLFYNKCYNSQSIKSLWLYYTRQAYYYYSTNIKFTILLTAEFDWAARGSVGFIQTFRHLGAPSINEDATRYTHCCIPRVYLTRGFSVTSAIVVSPSWYSVVFSVDAFGLGGNRIYSELHERTLGVQAGPARIFNSARVPVVMEDQINPFLSSPPLTRRGISRSPYTQHALSMSI